MAMDNKIREYLNDVFFGYIDYLSQYKLLKQITDNYDKDLIKGLFKEIVRHYWDNADKYKGYQKEKEWNKIHYYPPEKLYTQSPTKDYHKEYLLMPPIMEDSISILDSQIEVLSKLAVNNHKIKFIIGHIYKQIPMLPPIYEPVVKRTPQQEQEFCLEVLKKINDWLNEPNLYQYNESILFRYKDINIEGICEAYNQYETLYNGEWIQLGSYPEEGLYNPNPKEREQALNILRGLYDKIKPYEQQIKADMEYLEGNLMAYPHIKEKISYMANICRDYHDRIEFIENLNKSSKQDTTSTQKTNQNKKGRQTKSIQECISKKEDIERVLKLLHDYIDGKNGSAICLPLLAVIRLGKMTKPTHTQIINEFGEVITKSLYNAYMKEYKFNQVELDGVTREIAQDLG